MIKDVNEDLATLILQSNEFVLQDENFHLHISFTLFELP